MRVYSPFHGIGCFVCQPAQGMKRFFDLNHPGFPDGSKVLHMEVLNCSKNLSSSNLVKSICPKTYGLSLFPLKAYRNHFQTACPVQSYTFQIHFLQRLLQPLL